MAGRQAALVNSDYGGGLEVDYSTGIKLELLVLMLSRCYIEQIHLSFFVPQFLLSLKRSLYQMFSFCTSENDEYTTRRQSEIVIVVLQSQQHINVLKHC